MSVQVKTRTSEMYRPVQIVIKTFEMLDLSNFLFKHLKINKNFLNPFKPFYFFSLSYREEVRRRGGEE